MGIKLTPRSNHFGKERGQEAIGRKVKVVIGGGVPMVESL